MTRCDENIFEHYSLSLQRHVDVSLTV